MKEIKVDETHYAFIAAKAAVPALRNRETGEQKMSKGQPVSLVELMALPADETSPLPAQMLGVQVPGEPPAVVRGDPVAVVGLVARQHDFLNDRKERIKGVTFWAASITSLRGGQG